MAKASKFQNKKQGLAYARAFFLALFKGKFSEDAKRDHITN